MAPVHRSPRLGFALVCALGCGEPRAIETRSIVTSDAPLEAMVPLAPRVAAIERAPDLDAWLAACALVDGAPPRTLYTWTREEQIEALRRDRLLLTRGRVRGELSRFDTELGDDRHPIARHLRRDARARRYAWITPWATRMGWPAHDYGDRLIEVTLREDAWIARFDPAGPARWQVWDERGALVGERDVAGNVSRIAAVYHVASGENAYREIVIVDERNVERWAVDTEAMRERVREDAARLRALAGLFRSDAPSVDADFASWLRAGWRGSPRDAPDRYRACLALGSPAYAPSAEGLDAIASALERTPWGEPLKHAVELNRRYGVVMGSRTFCDETMGCWDANRRGVFFGRLPWM